LSVSVMSAYEEIANDPAICLDMALAPVPCRRPGRVDRLLLPALSVAEPSIPYARSLAVPLC